MNNEHEYNGVVDTTTTTITTTTINDGTVDMDMEMMIEKKDEVELQQQQQQTTPMKKLQSSITKPEHRLCQSESKVISSSRHRQQQGRRRLEKENSIVAVSNDTDNNTTKQQRKKRKHHRLSLKQEQQQQDVVVHSSTMEPVGFTIRRSQRRRGNTDDTTTTTTITTTPTTTNIDDNHSNNTSNNNINNHLSIPSIIPIVSSIDEDNNNHKINVGISVSTNTTSTTSSTMIDTIITTTPPTEYDNQMNMNVEVVTGAVTPPPSTTCCDSTTATKTSSSSPTIAMCKDDSNNNNVNDSNWIPNITNLHNKIDQLFCKKNCSLPVLTTKIITSSSSSTITSPPPTTTTTSQDEWYDLIIHRPCVSARVFACFVLWMESRTTTETTKSKLVNQIHPLLLAMIRVEALSLEENECISAPSSTATKKKGNSSHQKSKKTPLKINTSIKNEQKTPSSNSTKKMVHFLSLDGSSMRPPIDRDLQSGLRQQKYIEAMIYTKELMDSYVTSTTSDRNTTIVALQELVQFLQVNVKDNDLVQLCANSISIEYSPKLISITNQILKQDLILLLDRLSTFRNDPTMIDVVQNNNTSESTTINNMENWELPLRVELNLSEQIGQAIRYKLRVLFNPSPPRLSPLDTNYEIRSMTYSKVHQLVTMNKRTTEPSVDEVAQEGLAVDDAFVSALISRALGQLYDYYGLDHLVPISDDTNLNFLTIIPTEFCTTEPSNRFISPRNIYVSRTDPITVQDRDHVLYDVYSATSFLSATYAARFLLDLFTTPGVKEEVQRMGGWSDIARYASISWKYELYKSCPADAHLIPLHNYDSLLQRLQTLCHHMEPKVNDCITALLRVKHNYHIFYPSTTPKSSSKPKRALHSYMSDIVTTYTAMMGEVNAFPEIVQEPPPVAE